MNPKLPLQKKTLYEIPLYRGWIDDSQVDNDFLIKDALDNYDDKVSDDLLHTSNEDNQMPDSDEIINLISIIQNDYYNLTGYETEIETYWSHIQMPEQSTNLHNHDMIPRLMSGVYYPHTAPPEAGTLIFNWKDEKARWYSDGRVTNMQYTEYAELGKYLLFPPDLNHYVTRNVTNDVRVSISFNLEIKNLKVRKLEPVYGTN